jgi:RNA polymerase sigma-70 factor (ECF subfamily)
VEYKDQHIEIVEQCRKGERKAFMQLYNLYSAAMYNVALRMTGLTHIAEDILQESFTDAFTSLDKFRNESTFGAWLKRIVVYKSYDYLNSKSSQFDFVEDNEFFEAEEKEPDFNEEDMAREVQRIKDAVKQLPNGSRTILNLYLFEGYDHGEIAQIMNIAESTSKTQYMRAKRKVKELIENAGNYERQS